MVGKSQYQGYCQKFVMTAVSKSTGKYVATGNATNAWRMYGVSTSKTNVPRGAAVFFEGTNSDIGHVGIYVGDGWIVHATRSGIKKAKLSGMSKYRGWGWEQNAVLYSSDLDNPNAAGYVQTYQGDTVTVSGEQQQVQIWHAESPETIKKWGVLRQFKEVDTPSIGADMAKKMLQLYNRKKRTLKVTGAFGDATIRAGALVPVRLDLGDVATNNYMMVERVTHRFTNAGHTMDLTLEGAWED